MLKWSMGELTGLVNERKGTKREGEYPLYHTVHRGDGKTSGAAYDTAWVMRITDSGGHPLFPQCVQWILSHQKADGSWGSQITHYHDRIISTLGAITALREVYGNRFNTKIEQGEKYIWDTIEKLKYDSNRLIGSELLLPALMEQAETAGLNLPFHKTPYTHECTQKLAKIDESMWYSPETTLSFSLEFLGEDVNLKSLSTAQLPNGSIANSPAATAYFLTHWHEPDAVNYLKEILSLTRDGSIMTVYPVNTFEYGWVIYNLILAQSYHEWYRSVCTFLQDHLTATGIGCSTVSPLSDADDTAIVYKILSHMGYPVDFSVFDTYEQEEYFLTYHFEMDPSVSTNIHVLDLVISCPDFPQREDILEKLLHFLKKSMVDNHWVDKWHISPYYPTCHAILSLSQIDPTLADQAIHWIIDSQNPDGTWGLQGGSYEETALALQALFSYNRIEHVDLQCTKQPLGYITSMHPAGVLEPLWIGKVLYCPLRVVQSSLLSAELMYKMTLWDEFTSYVQRGSHVT